MKSRPGRRASRKTCCSLHISCRGVSSCCPVAAAGERNCLGSIIPRPAGLLVLRGVLLVASARCCSIQEELSPPVLLLLSLRGLSRILLSIRVAMRQLLLLLPEASAVVVLRRCCCIIFKLCSIAGGLAGHCREERQRQSVERLLRSCRRPRRKSCALWNFGSLVALVVVFRAAAVGEPRRLRKLRRDASNDARPTAGRLAVRRLTPSSWSRALPRAASPRKHG